MNLVWHHPDMLNVRKQLFCFVLFYSWGWGKGVRYIERQYKSQFLVAEVKCMTCFYKKVCGMHWHLRKENEVVLSYRWQFQDGRSIHRLLQTSILEWVVIPFSRESSQPRDRTWVSCFAVRLFTVWTIGKPHGLSCWLVKNTGTESK